jgi:hypothetical protein
MLVVSLVVGPIDIEIRLDFNKVIQVMRRRPSATHCAVLVGTLGNVGAIM